MEKPHPFNLSGTGAQRKASIELSKCDFRFPLCLCAPVVRFVFWLYIYLYDSFPIFSRRAFLDLIRPLVLKKSLFMKVYDSYVSPLRK